MARAKKVRHAWPVPHEPVWEPDAGTQDRCRVCGVHAGFALGGHAPPYERKKTKPSAQGDTPETVEAKMRQARRVLNSAREHGIT